MGELKLFSPNTPRDPSVVIMLVGRLLIPLYTVR